MLVKFDHDAKKARLCLRADAILPVLQKQEKEDPQ